MQPVEAKEYLLTEKQTLRIKPSLQYEGMYAVEDSDFYVAAQELKEIEVKPPTAPHDCDFAIALVVEAQVGRVRKDYRSPG